MTLFELKQKTIGVLLLIFLPVGLLVLVFIIDESTRAARLEKLKANPVAWAAEQERMAEIRRHNEEGRKRWANGAEARKAEAKRSDAAAWEKELNLCALRKSIDRPFMPGWALRNKCRYDWWTNAFSDAWRRQRAWQRDAYERALRR